MTDERKTPQTAADSEALVSRTYREAASDCAPEHLNQAVLRKAAGAARPRYARLRTWTRPVAWAATVALSVALVLEVTKVPAPGDVIFDENASKFEAKAPELEPAMVDESATEAVIDKRQRLDARKIRVETPQVAAPAPSASEFRVNDTDILQRAEDMARVQSENDKTIGPRSTSADAEASQVATMGATAAHIETADCDESARAVPKTWLECIAMLEEAGLAEEAEQQREMLRKEFPDFDTR